MTTATTTKKIKVDPDDSLLLSTPYSLSSNEEDYDVLDALLDTPNSSTRPGDSGNKNQNTDFITASNLLLLKKRRQQQALLEEEKKIDFTQNDDLFFIILSNVVVSQTISKLLSVFDRIENGRDIAQNQEAAMAEAERKKGFYINPNRWNLNWKDYKELKSISFLIGIFSQLNKKSAKNVLSLQECSTTQETNPREHWIMLYKTSYVVAKLYTIVQDYNYKHILPIVRYYGMEFARGDKIYKDPDTKTYHVDKEAFQVLLHQAKEKMSKTPEKYNKFVVSVETLQDYYSNLLMWKNHFFVYLAKYYNQLKIVNKLYIQ